MDTFFQYLIPISLIAVTVTLFIGLFALFRGGDFGRSYSNKLMRLRVVLQAIAVAVLVAAVWWRHNAGPGG
ncbi:twin transmembrane helix small protein [Phenylobacterium sp.]|uniref:twin transmembrane helix small protein n=1 Tax=Phenylobacterium sp. TaxID=1871053 RepID=UPI002733271D|nr:twin transmembrane helix small protein [Phenylobacterium sp.]MDP3854746.1 twin transmembrane helix small protein [Phenylobacterium sp.]